MRVCAFPRRPSKASRGNWPAPAFSSAASPSDRRSSSSVCAPSETSDIARRCFAASCCACGGRSAIPTRCSRTLPYLRWMFTRWFVVASSRCSCCTSALLANRWSEFVADLSATYSLHNITLADIVLLWVVGGGVILIHELGHGYACKYFGGEVHELGFMLIYFQPAFYCNVSDAWSFRERQRAAVGHGGRRVDPARAGQPRGGRVVGRRARHACRSRPRLAAMLVGGVTTLFTNANPLLPLDGYFALIDWLEIPNLRHRASRTFSGGSSEPCSGSTFPNRRRAFASGACFSFMAAGVRLHVGALRISRHARTRLGRTSAGNARDHARPWKTIVLLRRRIAEWGRRGRAGASARRSSRTLRRRLAFGFVAMVVLWQLFPGRSRVPANSSSTRSRHGPSPRADSGIVARVFVSEGMRVDAGAPLIRLVDRALERQLLAAGRAIDSLTVSESAARSTGRNGDASRLVAEANGGDRRAGGTRAPSRQSDTSRRCRRHRGHAAARRA